MNAWIEALQARWQAWWPELAPREQRMVVIAGALVLLALVWWVALAPALRTLASAPAAHAELDAQLQQMAALQIQAKALQSQPRANREDALRALETSVRQGLGPNAQIQVAGAGTGEGVLVTLRATPADSLAQWLAQARGNARAVPREVHLTRTQGGAQAPGRASGAFPSGPGAANRGAAAPAAADTRVRWDGTLVMNLPAR
ncbi:type II secretion system protein M [Variovorax sp. N23]|jgi:general secretion pathway protein M|uniref:type II secretion system protein M n=1 Tax=Variovorax sp. N23 TaxID=2980555 RepID=UPI0021C84A2A|nr:type II secretion system protein M [Variovorax sp. N23]MCU4120967.1 type II secretion system protein M [Variovorax sp. N23]